MSSEEKVTDKCPVCDSQNTKVVEWPDGCDGAQYNCPNCGRFILSGSITLEDMGQKDKALLSTAIWDKQPDNGQPPKILSGVVDAVENGSHFLPTPAGQLDRLIQYFGTYQPSPGKGITHDWGNFRAKIGMENKEDEEYILSAARSRELIERMFPPQAYGWLARISRCFGDT